MKINIFRIKPGKLEIWKAWCEELKARESEAKETLTEEGLSREACAIFELKNEWYVIGFMDGEGKPANMEREINKMHQEKKKECLEFISKGDIGYDFEVK